MHAAAERERESAPAFLQRVCSASGGASPPKSKRQKDALMSVLGNHVALLRPVLRDCEVCLLQVRLHRAVLGFRLEELLATLGPLHLMDLAPAGAPTCAHARGQLCARTDRPHVTVKRSNWGIQIDESRPSVEIPLAPPPPSPRLFVVRICRQPCRFAPARKIDLAQARPAAARSRRTCVL